MRKNTNLQGFTLIEILIVIGLIAILAAVTIVALNPSSSLESARNSERNLEISQIHNAINRFVIDGGTMPTLPACPPAEGDTISSKFTAGLPTSIAGRTFSYYLPTYPKDPEDATKEYRVCNLSGATRIDAPLTDGTLVSISR